jgi:hypothetical protein
LIHARGEWAGHFAAGQKEKLPGFRDALPRIPARSGEASSSMRRDSKRSAVSRQK